jgi:nanoRNase/pAp phosphatase (c-di-AMP/oligoRNAs hydrolase)
MDVILGCGSVGYSTAQLLQERGRDILIVDKSRERVEDLRDSGMDAIQGDIRDLDALRGDLEGADSLLLLCSDMDANLEAIEYIRGEFHDAHVVVRALDPVSADALNKAGADEVIQPSDVIAQAVVHRLDEWELQRAGDELRATVESADSVAIFLHDNPDPDALGSGFALQAICQEYGTDAPIYYGGNIGHQENRAFVNLLDIELNRVGPESPVLDIINSYDKVALVDCAVAGRNNILPREVVPNIVFDHHQVEDGDVIADFAEVRSGVGATCTILTKYLQQLEVGVGDHLAVGLLYGIRTDTEGFTGGATAEDMQAATWLSSFADMDLLDQIESPPMAGDTVDVLGQAIMNREVYGSTLVTHVGFIGDRDILPQAADFLLNLEGVSTVLVYGIVEDVIHLSGRSNDVRVNLGDALAKAFGKDNAGGHARSAGGQIKLGIFGDVEEKEALVRLARDAVQKQFLEELGVDSDEE